MKVPRSVPVPPDDEEVGAADTEWDVVGGGDGVGGVAGGGGAGAAAGVDAACWALTACSISAAVTRTGVDTASMWT